MSGIPRDGSFDSSFAFIREGYEFVSNRCRRHGTDAFETRLGFRTAVCMQGEEAARLFYGAPVTRRGALPVPILALLQDKGSVATLDDHEHRRRKQLFLSLSTPAALERLVEVNGHEWERSIDDWLDADYVVLLDAVEELLCRTACAWAGVPLETFEVRERTAELAAMIDGAGSLGPRNWRGHLRRRRTERWAAQLVRDIRAGILAVPEWSAVKAIAHHHDLDGRLLDEDVAAVELLNVLRPTVAVARYVVFAALALHDYPHVLGRLDEDGDEALGSFVHEVRRFYPFFPAIAGRVAEEFEWRGYTFPTGRLLLLDLYGTNRDSRLWDAPGEFRPERFRGWKGDPFTFVPQGGGDHAAGHRCAGEWMTIELMKVGVRALTQLVRFEVPPQDLRVRLSRMPARPESGFVIRDVNRIGKPDAVPRGRARRRPGRGRRAGRRAASSRATRPRPASTRAGSRPAGSGGSSSGRAPSRPARGRILPECVAADQAQEEARLVEHDPEVAGIGDPLGFGRRGVR
jgi:fatty-acid peroxygenase